MHMSKHDVLYKKRKKPYAHVHLEAMVILVVEPLLPQELTVLPQASMILELLPHPYGLFVTMEVLKQ